MKIILLSILLFLCSSCSVTLVYVEKHSYIDGQGNDVNITGSDLEGNTASQSADGEIDLPIP